MFSVPYENMSASFAIVNCLHSFTLAPLYSVIDLAVAPSTSSLFTTVILISLLHHLAQTGSGLTTPLNLLPPISLKLTFISLSSLNQTLTMALRSSTSRGIQPSGWFVRQSMVNWIDMLTDTVVRWNISIQHN